MLILSLCFLLILILMKNQLISDLTNIFSSDLLVDDEFDPIQS